MFCYTLKRIRAFQTDETRATMSDAAPIGDKAQAVSAEARERFLKAQRERAAEKRQAKAHKEARSKAVQRSQAWEGREHGAPRKDGRIRKDQMAGYGKPPPEALTAQVGRPSTYDHETREMWKRAITAWLSEGRTLADLYREYPEAPARITLGDWMADDPSFASSWVRARALGADALADKVLSTAEGVQNAGRHDMARVGAAKLLTECLKWTASKLKPQAYADRLETHVTHSGTVGHEVKLSDKDRAIALASIMARHAVQGADSLPSAIAALAQADPSKLIEATAAPVVQSADTKEPV